MKTKHEQMTENKLDNYSNFIGNIDDIKDFYCFMVQTRDSNLLEKNNFKNGLLSLGGESKSIQVHKFNHWACGWFEQILINPENTEAILKAENILSALSDCPVLDESDYYNELYEEVNNYWDNLSLSDKIDLCKTNNESIFACRYNLPEKIYNHLSDILA